MGRLGGTGKTATGQRVAQLREILSFTPDADGIILSEDKPDKNELNENPTVEWVARDKIHLTFSFVPGNWSFE